MTPLQQTVIEVARDEVVRKVREVPSGSNRGPRIDVYIRDGGGLEPIGHHYPYCASFVGWCIIQAAARLRMTAKFKRGASIQKLLDGRNAALKIDVPEPGCVWMKFNPADQTGHCGIVTAVNMEAGTMETIEANTGPGPDVPAKDRDGDGVWARHRQIAEATAGFLRIA